MAAMRDLRTLPIMLVAIAALLFPTGMVNNAVNITGHPIHHTDPTPVHTHPINIRGQVYQYENDYDFPIPNPDPKNPNRPGEAASPLNLSATEDYTIINPKIFVGIKHPWIGDLVVAVIPPWAQGSEGIVILHNREGGDSDDIYKWYDLTTTPELSQWIGRKPYGMWYLYVQDWAIHYTTPSAGYIDDWILWFEGNYPPTQPVVDITPDSPKSDDTLVAVAQSSDRDGDAITYEYKWYRNGDYMPQFTTSIVPASATASGERWSCRVIATDGTNSSTPGMDTVVVGNQAPTRPSIAINPSDPMSGDDISVEFKTQSYDDNGDVTYIIDWYRNGNIMPLLHNSTRVSHNLTAKGDIWRCIVTPVDILGAHGPSANATTTVRNTPPTPPTMFSPSATRDTRPWIWWWGATDIDLDVLTYNVSVRNESGIVFQSHVDVGEGLLFPKRVGYGEYVVEISSHDGTDESDVGTFNMKIGPESNTPPTSVGQIYPNRTSDRSPRIYWEPSEDADGDNLTYMVQIGTHHGEGDVLPFQDVGNDTHIDLDATLDYGMYFIQVVAFDGTTYSKVREAILYIEFQFNSPPYPPDTIMVNLHPLPSEVYSIDTISWSGAVDPDGDNLSYTLSVGHGWGKADVLGPIDVGTNTTYTWPNDAGHLEPGSYYVSVSVRDSSAQSPPTSFIVVVLPPNHDPHGPVIYGPQSTQETRPEIFWYGAWDEDGDTIRYKLKLTDESGNVTFIDVDVGDENTYLPEFELPYGQYMVSLSVEDLKGGKTMLHWSMVIGPNADIPPMIVGEIEPKMTQNPMPRLYWPHASDPDSSVIYYYLAIGTMPYRDDVIPWFDNDILCSYTPSIPLPHGTYYVTVYPHDGKSMGPPIISTLVITDTNNPPMAVDEIGPDEVTTGAFRVWWTPTTDPDGDEVYYYFRLEGGGMGDSEWDIVYDTFKEVSIEKSGSYQVTIMASDGMANSTPTVHEIHVTTKGNNPPYPPADMVPYETPNARPTIYWYGAWDRDGDSLSYYIAIGTLTGSEDVLGWTSTDEVESFQIPFDLVMGTYYVHIRSYDGEALSQPYVHTLIVAANADNVPVFDEPYNERLEVNTSRPTIPIPTAHDADGDDLTYLVSIGTAPFQDDVIGWTDIGSAVEFVPDSDLQNGEYFVAIRAGDGTQLSQPAYIQLIVDVPHYKYTFALSGKDADTNLVTLSSGESYTLHYTVTNTGDVVYSLRIEALADHPDVVPYVEADGISGRGTVEVNLSVGRGVGVNVTVTSPQGVSGEFNITLIFTSTRTGYNTSRIVTFHVQEGVDEGGGGGSRNKVGIGGIPNLWLSLIIVLLIAVILIVYVIVRGQKGRKRAVKGVNVKNGGKERGGGDKGVESVTPDMVIKPRAKAVTTVKRIPKAASIAKKTKGGEGGSDVVEVLEAEIEYEPDLGKKRR